MARKDKRLAALDSIITRAADTYGVPKQLVQAVIKQESGGNISAKSHAGAQGLMQLMPDTAKALGVSDPWDPEQNIFGGVKYLSQQYKTFGNWKLALAAYNAGPGNVKKHGGVPPFKETQNYVKSIFGMLNSKETLPIAPVAQKLSGMDFLMSKYGPKQPESDPFTPSKQDVKSPTKQLTGMDFLMNKYGNSPKPGDMVDGIQPIQSVQSPTTQPDPTQLPNMGELGRETMSFLEGVTPSPRGVLNILGLGENFDQIAGLGNQLSANADASALNALKLLGIEMGLTQPGDMPKAVSPDQIMQDRILRDQQIAGAVQENPIANIAGATAQAIPLMAATGGSSSLPGLMATGAAESAILEAANNPNATLGTTALAAGMGGAIPGIQKGVAALVKKPAELLLDFTAGRFGIGKDIMENLGFSLTRNSLLSKNQRRIMKAENELFEHLANNNVALNVKDILDPADLLSLAKKYSNSPGQELKALGSLLEGYADKITKTGSLDALEANTLKSLLWKEAKYTKAGDPSQTFTAKAYDDMGHQLKELIEKKVGGKVRELNKTIGQGIDVKNAFKKAKPEKLRSMLEAGAAITNPGTLGSIIGGRLATSVPGATGLGVMSKAAAGLTDNETIRKILTILAPQAVDKLTE